MPKLFYQLKLIKKKRQKSLHAKNANFFLAMTSKTRSWCRKSEKVVLEYINRHTHTALQQSNVQIPSQFVELSENA